MATNATSVTKTWKGASATFDERSDTIVEAYDVVLLDASRADGAWQAVHGDDGTTAVPLRGSAHATHTHLRVTNITPQLVIDEPWMWRVLVTYSSRTNYPGLNFQGSIDPEFVTNPFVRPYEVELGEVVMEVPQLRDYSSPPKALHNSAGQPFDPPRLVRRTIQTLVVTRWVAGIDPGLATIWNDVVNKDNWAIADKFILAGVARVHSITARTFYESGYAGWEQRFEWHLWAEVDLEGNVFGGWNNHGVLDQGYKTVTDEETGASYNKPVFFDGSGEVIDPRETGPTYLSFKLYRTAPYTGSAIDVI